MLIVRVPMNSPLTPETMGRLKEIINDEVQRVLSTMTDKDINANIVDAGDCTGMEYLDIEIDV